MSSHPSTRSHPARSWIWRLFWPVVLAFTIYHASGQTTVAAPSGIANLDKLAHFSLFGLLATLTFRVVYDSSRPGRTALIAAAVVSLYGMVDEFRQSFTPGRSVEFADWIADTTGALTAVLAYGFWSAYRRVLEWVIWPRRSRSAPPAGGSPA